MVSAQSSFTPVILESPFAGDVGANLSYLRSCMRDCLLRGEAPFASHGLYTQPGVLDDAVPAEREHGIAAGFAWRGACTKTVIYCDRGCSGGMLAGYTHAVRAGHEIEFRTLYPGTGGSVGVHAVRGRCERSVEVTP